MPSTPGRGPGCVAGIASQEVFGYGGREGCEQDLWDALQLGAQGRTEREIRQTREKLRDHTGPIHQVARELIQDGELSGKRIEELMRLTA